MPPLSGTKAPAASLLLHPHKQPPTPPGLAQGHTTGICLQAAVSIYKMGLCTVRPCLPYWEAGGQNGKARTRKSLPGDGESGGPKVWVGFSFVTRKGTQIPWASVSPFCKNKGIKYGMIKEPSQPRPLLGRLSGPSATFRTSLPAHRLRPPPQPAQATCPGYSLWSAPPALQEPGAAPGWE